MDKEFVVYNPETDEFCVLFRDRPDGWWTEKSNRYTFYFTLADLYKAGFIRIGEL